MQLLINRQACTVIDAYRTTPTGPLLRDAGLELVETVPYARQHGFAARLLGLPEGHPGQLILPVSFRERDRHAQPGEQPLEDREWAVAGSRGQQSLGQRLGTAVGKHTAHRPISWL
jgi:hypothetical protein